MGGLLLVQDFLRQSASQSLLHQRTVSQNNTAVTTVAPPQVSIASSSANSFTGTAGCQRPAAASDVSIASSSANSFTECCGCGKQGRPTESQSLLHQRTVSQQNV